VLNITKSDALAYHSGGRPGKIEITATKPCRTQRDQAYTPGVAQPCLSNGGQLQRTAQKSVSVDSETPLLLLQNVI
jgi:malic enzyme